MIEFWKPAKGWESRYLVSSAGRVRGIRRGRILKPFETRTGYLRVCFFSVSTKKNYSIHVLVLKAFKGPRPKGFQGAHLNGNKLDNRLSNLAWMSVRDNCLQKREHGVQPEGEKHVNAKLTEKQVIGILLGEYGLDLKKVARRFGVDPATLRSLRSGKSWFSSAVKAARAKGILKAAMRKPPPMRAPGRSRE